MDNIVLIGMPGVGKSTIGVVLAKMMGYQFVDTDLIIQQRSNKKLKEIIAELGVDGFIKMENTVVASVKADHTVIATGGSVVYGKEAMEHLKGMGHVIYLKVSYENLTQRLGSLKGRGVVLRENQDLKALYEERIPLYEKYADMVIDEENLDLEGTLQKIINNIKM